jgi:hypothetical protein
MEMGAEKMSIDDEKQALGEYDTNLILAALVGRWHGVHKVTQCGSLSKKGVAF